MIKAVVFDYGGVIFKNLRWHHEMFELASDLRKKGYKTALLSNMYVPVAWIIRRRKDTYDFDPAIISSEVGHSKPWPEIYKILLEQLKLPAEECIFMDDRPENLVTAGQLGFQTVHVVNPKQTAADIRKLLL
jgi:epoxide hydrolase-like predicted phosphatase